MISIDFSTLEPNDVITLGVLVFILISVIWSVLDSLKNMSNKRKARAISLEDIEELIGPLDQNQGIDMDQLLAALNAPKPRRTTARRRQSGTTQQQVTQNILRALSMQRRNNQ